jgi:AP endonuclease-1
VEDQSRIRICLDTCHMFAAGYDIRTPKAYEDTMRKFGEDVGFKYLGGMHLNDSKAALASCKDLHENIGLQVDAVVAMIPDSVDHEAEARSDFPRSD